MIKFHGYLTGNSQKRFFKKAIEYAQARLIVGVLLSLTLLPGMANIMHMRISFEVLLQVVCAIFTICLLGMLLVRIPTSKKAKQLRITKEICIEDGVIVCISDKYQEIRKISDVKKVLDYGEFYELVFILGKQSEKFICQKSLLVCGSFEEFEQLFKRIERKF